MAQAGEEERGYRQGPFVPVGSTNRDQIPPFVLGPMVPDGATNRDKRVTLWSQLVAPTGTKGPCPPTLPRLAVGPETKALFGPGSKGSRDK